PMSLILISRTPEPTAFIGFQSSGSKPFCTARSSTPARYRTPSGKVANGIPAVPEERKGLHTSNVSESIHRGKAVKPPTRGRCVITQITTRFEYWLEIDAYLGGSSTFSSNRSAATER